ncbi:hypothetical protein N9D02_02900 [Emcibacteraceae bacterium]|nr:hypothetical protein [Emcibacteraceae bacterium]
MSAEQETDQERRITFCLYESWEKIAGSSGLPALKRLQRQEIEAFKSNLVLLDLRNGKDNPIFQVIGNGLTEDLEVDLVGRPIAEVPRRSMLSRVTDHYLEVLANRVPIAFEAEFVNREGEKALYRGILLPFSDDNQNINFILGGVRWILAKDVQLDEDKPTIEELMRTIASGRDEITLENEEDVLNEDQLDATLSQETTDDTLQDSLKQVIRYIKKEDASHNRSRDSLYNILTAIYKFHSVCENSPVEYSKLVAENGLKIQERAPFTPVLKICLGKDYDKTRLTEYAAALGIAKHMNVDVEDFHDFIKHFPGGIKGCVKEMRAIRKGSNGANLVQQSRTVEEARNVLRDMPVIGRIRLKKMIVSKDADEFCLLLAKRRGHDIDVLKVLDDQYTKIDPILKRAAFINGNLKKEN